ncbi:ATP-binding protein [Streptomyces sp. NPDC046887]|uniref:ATP-binding protein n=1 Tax=Streptomyces sp. NPDC046887 TaxID=3155472 RepID=UPI0033D4D407
MIVGTVENVTAGPEVVRDDFTLNLRRDPELAGRPVAPHEGRWVGHLRRIGAARLCDWGLQCLVDDAQTAISELVTNALRHGTGERVVFRFLLAADVLAIEVDDGSTRQARIGKADDLDENGRGMFIVSALSTVCGVSPDGTRTWCCFEIPAPARGYA